MTDETAVVEPLPIDHFARDARADLALFQARYGSYFLVRNGPLAPERRPKRPQVTVVMRGLGAAKSDPPNEGAPPKAASGRPSQAQAEIFVFPIRRTGRSPYPSMITVGRTKNNDIVLADVGISKFHAFFKEEDGKLVLHDAESRNGTTVDDAPAPTAKAGKPATVTRGSKVRFGLLEFWVVDAAGLQELARAHAGPGGIV